MNLQEQNDILKEALQILVDAKDRKEEFGDKDFTYMALKGEGWAKARHALKHTSEPIHTINEINTKHLLYYGENVDKSIDIDTDNGRIDYVTMFMFDQLNKDIRSKIEPIFWSRLTKLANLK